MEHMTDELEDKEQEFEMKLNVLVLSYGKPRVHGRLLAQRIKKILEVSLHKQVTVLLEESDLEQWLVTYEKQFSDTPVELVTLHRIIDEAVKLFGYSREDLLGERRFKDLIKTRHITWYVAKNLIPELSYPRIGNEFNRDHTTIISGIQRITKLVLTDANTRNTVSLLISRVTSV